MCQIPCLVHEEAGFPQQHTLTDTQLTDIGTQRLNQPRGFQKAKIKDKAEDIAFAALLDKKDNGRNNSNKKDYGYSPIMYIKLVRNNLKT